MSSIRLNISVTEEQARFLEENKNFSPSKIIQSKLFELMETSRDSAEMLKHEKEKNARIIITLNKQIDFINYKNLMEEFSKWKN